jgi:hypothetical protein
MSDLDDLTPDEEHLAHPFESVNPPTGVRRWHMAGANAAVSSGRGGWWSRPVVPFAGAVALALVVGVAGGSVGWWHRSNAPATPGSTAISARSGAAMAYDRDHHQMVLFGGQGAGGLLNDTWTWDGTQWHQQHPSASPGSRSDAVMAWDPASHRLILTGGMGSTTSGNPNHICPMLGLPEPATVPNMGPTATSGRGKANIVPPSGVPVPCGPSIEPLRETWSWDGSNWTDTHARNQLPAGSVQLAADATHLIALTSFDGAYATSGGGSGSVTGSCTVTSEGASVCSAQSSPGITVPGGTSVGACSANTKCSVLQSVTWSWTGQDWKKLTGAVSPSLGAQLASDPSGGVLALASGSNCYGIMSNSNSAVAGNVMTTPACPVPMMGAAMACPAPAPDTSPAKGILSRPGGCGGISLCCPTTSWSWNGSAWTALTATGNPPPGATGISSDGTRGVVVVGADRNTYELTGTVWTRHQLVIGPSARRGAALAFDETGNVTLLFGGGGFEGGLQSDTWAWNGTRWLQVGGAPATATPVPTKPPTAPPKPSSLPPCVESGNSAAGMEICITCPLTPAGSTPPSPCPPAFDCPLMDSGPPAENGSAVNGTTVTTAPALKGRASPSPHPGIATEPTPVPSCDGGAGPGGGGGTPIPPQGAPVPQPAPAGGLAP